MTILDTAWCKREMGSGRLGFGDLMQCNAPAVRLYERLGFVLDGVAREDAFLNGRFENSALYSMLSREFQQKFDHQTS